MSRGSFFKFAQLSIAFLGLSLLWKLQLDQCNLTPGVIKSDNSLDGLKELSLRNCNLNGGGAFQRILHLSSLEVLNLSGCNPEEGGTLSDILVGISQLSNLRALDFNHCKKLSQFPELPSSLRLLDLYSSVGTSLPPMHSLVNCLKSANRVRFSCVSVQCLYKLYVFLYVGIFRVEIVFSMQIN